MKPFEIIFFLLIMLALIGGAHWLVYHAITRFFPVNGAWPKITFAVLAASFVIMSVVVNIGSSRIGDLLYTASAIWLGTLYWLFFASLAALAVYGASNLFLSHPLSPLAGRAILLIGVLTSVYGLAHAQELHVTRYAVSIPDLPVSWQGQNIVLVADTHFGAVRSLSFSRKVVRLIAEQKPAAVLFAGDFFDGPPMDFDKAVAPWKELNVPKGIYFANGNHEEFRDSGIYDGPLREAGITVLDDELKVVDGLQIAGVNFGTSNSDADNAATLKKIGLDSTKPSILIKHAPNALQSTSAAGVSLQVSGHTHQGQVWPGPWLTNMLFKGFAYGKHSLGNLQVITTSGAGTWGPPQRVGTNAEIVVITLDKVAPYLINKADKSPAIPKTKPKKAPFEGASRNIK